MQKSSGKLAIHGYGEGTSFHLVNLAQKLLLAFAGILEYQRIVRSQRDSALAAVQKNEEPCVVLAAASLPFPPWNTHWRQCFHV